MAIYCADSQLGNNANSGVYNAAGATPDLKWANAKQSLAAAWAVMSPGDTLYTRIGSRFAPLAGEGRVMVSYVNKSNITIEAIARYPSDLTEVFPWDWRKGLGGADYDVTWWRGAGFDNMPWDPPNAGGWAHVGDGGANGPIGTWRKSFGASAPGASSGEHYLRVFRDSTLSSDGTRLSHMRVGDGLANAMSKSQLNTRDCWYTAVNGDGTTANDDYLYMYTGSATVSPDQFFGGLTMLHNAASTAQTSGGGARSFVVRNATGVRIKNLLSIGATSGGFGCSSPTALPNIEDIIFENCVSLCCGFRAIRNDFTFGFPCAGRVKYLNCVSISNLGQNEQLLVAANDHRAAFEAMEITDYAKGVVIINPTVVDSFHGAFSITAASMALAPVDSGVIGGKVRWSSRSTDGHGFALTRATRCFILGTEFDGCPTSSHFGPDGNVLRGVKMIKRIFNDREPTENRCIVDIYSTGSDACTNGMIEDSTFDVSSMESAYTLAPIAFVGQGSAAPILANACVVRNNLMVLGQGHVSVLRFVGSGGYVHPNQQVYGNRSVTPSGAGGEFGVVNNQGAAPYTVRAVTFGDAYGLYTHTQASAASTWNINHGLNSVDVDVNAVVGGLYKSAATVVIVDANNVQVSNLGGSVTGTATVVKAAFGGASNNARTSLAAADLDADLVPRLTSPLANILPSTGIRLGRNRKMRRLPNFTPGCQDPLKPFATRL